MNSLYLVAVEGASYIGGIKRRVCNRVHSTLNVLVWYNIYGRQIIEVSIVLSHESLFVS